MKKYIYTSAVFIAFFAAVVLFTRAAESDAQGIRDSVFRFHVIGASDSDTDQSNKLAVRDGLAELCSALFGDADGKTAAMQTAADNTEIIEQAAMAILKSRGCDMPVTASVTQRFFPTRSYDGVSLPAGVYDTLDVRIGEAAGKNFWCVMFPDICIGASSKRTNREKMSGLLDGGSRDMVLNSQKPVVRFKFKTVELFQTVKNFLFAQK